jgi:hypothetical protein
MHIEIYLEDVCLDLLLGRKHVYNCTTGTVYSKRLITYTCGCENMYSIFGREYMRRSGRHCCCLYTGMAGKSSWDQANRRQKLGLVWRIRKKISQIIKDYFYLLFFLLIIL